MNGSLNYLELITHGGIVVTQALEVPIGTVRSRIARGRGLLVPLLAPGNQSHPFDRPTPAP